jgi:hypothetical protein
MQTRMCYLLSLACTLGATTLSRADFLTIDNPSSVMANSTPYLTGTTLLPIVGSEFTTVSSLSSGGLTIGLSSPAVVYQVGSGWDQAGWGVPPATETLSPKLLSANGVADLTLTFSKALSAFGIEASPGLFGTHPFTAAFYNGATLVGTSSHDIATSRLFAAEVTNSTPAFTSVRLTSDGDFGIAQFRYTPATSVAAVPEPSSCLLALTCLGCMGVSNLWKRRHKTS